MRAPAAAERQFPDSVDGASSILSTFSLMVTLTLLCSDFSSFGLRDLVSIPNSFNKANARGLTLILQN